MDSLSPAACAQQLLFPRVRVNESASVPCNYFSPQFNPLGIATAYCTRDDRFPILQMNFAGCTYKDSVIMSNLLKETVLISFVGGFDSKKVAENSLTDITSNVRTLPNYICTKMQESLGVECITLFVHM